MESSMYNRLLLLPIFTGMTTEELTQMLAHIHMEFQQYEPGEVIATQDDRCDKLIYVLRGCVKVECVDRRNHFMMQEFVEVPFLIELYNLYGLQQQFQHTYMAEERTDTVTISKQEFHTIMLNYKIPRTNVMNMLCAKVQHLEKDLRTCEVETVGAKIKQFFKKHVLNTKGKKILHIKMEDMAAYIGETRLSVSNTLKAWNLAGLISQPRRGVIQVDDLTKLK